MNEWLDGRFYIDGWMNDGYKGNGQSKRMKHGHLPIRIDAD